MSDLAEFLRDLQHALDEHDRRLARLEEAPLVNFRMAETIEQRRRVVARMRAAGLSTERIARATGSPRSTVMRDLAAIRSPTPARVTDTVNGRGWTRPQV